MSVTTRSGKTCRMVCSNKKRAAKKSGTKKSGTKKRKCSYGKRKQYGGINNYNKCPENKTLRAARLQRYREQGKINRALPFAV